MQNDNLDFEEWVKKCYPKTFQRWDIEASHLIDLDEYLMQEYPSVIKDWRKHQKAERKNDSRFEQVG